MKLLIRDVEDVLGCVWLATASLAYVCARGFSSTQNKRTEQDFVFSQIVIQETAQQVCAKTVQNARISQWANADHPKHTRNYLRAVGAGRRLTRPDECDGIRVLPWELVPFETPVLAFDGEDKVVHYGELVAWVLDVFPQLVPLREAVPRPPQERRTVARPALPRAPELEPMETLADVGANTLTLRLEGREFEFRKVPLVFEDHGHRDVFQFDTRRTVAKALLGKHFKRLRPSVETRFPQALTQPLGQFLANLKKAGDPFYHEFLNPSGDLEYSTFSIRDPRVLAARGLYAYTLNGTLHYIGRCLDKFSLRVNQQYGRIRPRSCYKDGHSTNCHINSLLAQHRDAIGFYVHLLADKTEISTLETLLIAAYDPPWNKRR